MRILLIFFVVLNITRSLSQIHFPTDESRGNFNYDFRNNQENDEVDNIIANGILNLTLSLAREIDKVQENLVYAPVNIAAVLAMILMGSSGKTFQELSNLLGIASGVDIENNSELVHDHFGKLFKKIDKYSSFDLGEEVSIATALFVQNSFPIRPLYKTLSKNIYRSEIVSVDFQSDPQKVKNTINTWVSDRTRNKIQSILNEDPDAKTKLIIAGALYFKAAWEQPFFSGLTQQRTFFPNGRKSESTMKTDMMSNGGLFPYYHDRQLDCEIMGFPYKGNQSTMYVVIPKHSNKENLFALERKLDTTQLERLISNTRYQKSVIAFPRMKLDLTYDLTQPLKNLGVKSLFDPVDANLALLSPGKRLQSLLVNKNFAPNPEMHDDLQTFLIFSRSGFVDNDSKNEENLNISRKTRAVNTLDTLRLGMQANENPGLYADKVLHKVYMEITETGTEAAAATSVSLTRGGDFVTFRVDVPFLFFIRNHETKIVLFWGAVTEPTPNYV